jgi:hypothetical protein
MVCRSRKGQFALVQLSVLQALCRHRFDVLFEALRRQIGQSARRRFHRIGQQHNRGFLALRLGAGITKQGFIRARAKDGMI